MSEIQPIKAVRSVSIPSLQCMVESKLVDSMMDSLEASKLTVAEVAILRNYPVDIQKDLKGFLFKNYPHLLEPAQCEQFKCILETQSYWYRKIYPEGTWMVFSGDIIKSFNLLNNNMTVIDLVAPVTPRVLPFIGHGRIYYCSGTPQEGQQIYTYDIANKSTATIFALPRGHEVKAIFSIEDDKLMIECANTNKQRSVAICMDGRLRIQYPNKRMYSFCCNKKYGCIFDTAARSEGSVNLYCVDIMNEMFHGPFTHENDLHCGNRITPFITDNEEIVTVVRNACHVSDIKTSRLIRIITFDHPISHMRARGNALGKEIMVNILSQKNRNIVLNCDLNTQTYTQVFEEPDVSFKYFKASKNLDMLYTDRGVYSPDNRILFSFGEDMRWVARSLDMLLVEKNKNLSEDSLFSYKSHLSLSEAPLTDLLTLLIAAQQKKSSSSVEKEVLDILNQSKSDRIREIAARYLAKHG